MEGNQQSQAGAHVTNATPGLVGGSFFLAIALITYAIRMFTRIRPVFKLGAPDYIISAALLCELGAFACFLASIAFGFGHYESYLSADAMVKILKCFYVLGLMGFWASTLARISIGTMVLRFEISRPSRAGVWILIAIQVIMAIGATVFALANCRPIRAAWEQVPEAVCWPARVSQIYGYVFAALGTSSDLVFAAMPLFFIWTLNRPVIERILLSVLMALGTIAAVAGAVRVVYIHIWDPQTDSLHDLMPLFWWYRVEEIGLITAACAPFLKPTIERLLSRFSTNAFGFVTMKLNTIRLDPGNTPGDIPETSSVQWSTQDMNSTQHDSGQAASITLSGGFDHSSNQTKFQREPDWAEAV
ncbi:hypothetical protein ACJZ2D_016904 [Fusarium nematophilum]